MAENNRKIEEAQKKLVIIFQTESEILVSFSYVLHTAVHILLCLTYENLIFDSFVPN
jgi:hypothetical protein